MKTLDYITPFFRITDSGYFGYRAGKNHVRFIDGNPKLNALLFFIQAIGNEPVEWTDNKKGFVCEKSEGVTITIRLASSMGDIPAIDIKVEDWANTPVKSQKIHFVKEHRDDKVYHVSRN